MKKFLIILFFIMMPFIMMPYIQAKTYYLDERPITDLNLTKNEVKKYRWYQNERLEAFYLMGENPDLLSKTTNDYYYTAYST